MGSGIGDKDWILKWELGLKLVYRLKIIFELEVNLIIYVDAWLVSKCRQLNLKLFSTKLN